MFNYIGIVFYYYTIIQRIVGVVGIAHHDRLS